MSAMLSVDGINAGYGEMQVLWDVSLEVRKGEIVTLVGSNGAGKTTTLRVISGILMPTEGKVVFEGNDITYLDPHKRVEMGIAHVPEGRGLFPRMTVYENLMAAAYVKRARERFRESLETVYQLFPILKERRSQLAGSLSGGEQQMLAIARALILRPKLLMLDEPSLGLAPKIVVMILELIGRLRDEGYTILLVEQNVRQALQIADRAYVIETGRIVKHGNAKELLEDPEVKRAYLGI